MTISYVKKCVDSGKISLINLAYDIFGLLAKNAPFFSLQKYILFNKRKKIHGILLKITMYTVYICPNNILMNKSLFVLVGSPIGQKMSYARLIRLILPESAHFFT